MIGGATNMTSCADTAISSSQYADGGRLLLPIGMLTRGVRLPYRQPPYR